MSTIAKAIAAQKVNIDSRLDSGLTTHDALTALDKQLDMCLEEYMRFQDLKSIAVLHEVLTLDDGNLVFDYLGNSPDRFNRQPLEVKVVLTNLFTELLQWKVMSNATII
jgi:hypothetical protein